jgi:hypothetical protein
MIHSQKHEMMEAGSSLCDSADTKTANALEADLSPLLMVLCLGRREQG